MAFVILDHLRREGEEKGLGLVFFDTGFALPAYSDTVRVPDVAFVASHRIPEEGITDRFWELSPDLVVEVLSPSNRASDMQRKALEYLEAGAGLVWIADPAEQRVAVYQSRSDIRILVPGDVMEGGGVLPDFRMPVEEIFE